MNNKIIQIDMYNKDIIYILVHDNSEDAYNKAKSGWCRNTSEWINTKKEFLEFEFDGELWYFHDSYDMVYRYQRHHFTETDISQVDDIVLKSIYTNGSHYLNILNKY